MTTLNIRPIPANAKRISIRPLALGEKTGHHHSLVLDPESALTLNDAVEMYEIADDAGPALYLRVTADGVSVQHQEHKTQPVAPGDYVVTIQREFTDWGARRVED